MKRALILGSRGQDGRLLWDYLKGLGYALTGLDKGFCETHESQWSTPVDIRNRSEVARAVFHIAPHEIYHLAAIHSSSEKADDETTEAFETMFQVNFLSLLYVLQTVLESRLESKVFFAASSHVFGDQGGDAQDETTPIAPESIYAMTKANGMWVSRWFRKRGVFTSTGILYPHESPLRSAEFLSKKVARAVAEIQRHERKELILGNLSAEVDWGHARDFVRAMQVILQLEKPDDFIIATGRRKSVRDFVITAFGLAGLDWRRYVREDPCLIKRPIVVRVGNPAKLTALTSWKPQTTFEEMIRELLMAEGVRLKLAHYDK